MRSRVLGLVLLALLGQGCKTTEEKLIDLRFEHRALVDELYGQYGGGAIAGDLKAATEKAAAEQQKKPNAGAAASDLLRAFGEAAAEVDRQSFEDTCLVVGRGERPFLIMPKAKDFFAREETRERCKRVVLLQSEIDALASRPAAPGGAKD